MSFTFNWNGFTVPQAQKQGYEQQSIDAAGMFGKAVAGYERNRANQEYAGIIDRYNQNMAGGPDITAMQAELEQLKARNAEIAVRLGIDV